MNWKRLDPNRYVGKAMAPHLPENPQRLMLVMGLVIGGGVGFGVAGISVAVIYQAHLFGLAFLAGTLFFIYAAFYVSREMVERETNE